MNGSECPRCYCPMEYVGECTGALRGYTSWVCRQKDCPNRGWLVHFWLNTEEKEEITVSEAEIPEYTSICPTCSKPGTIMGKVEYRETLWEGETKFQPRAQFCCDNQYCTLAVWRSYYPLVDTVPCLIVYRDE